jgi:hypothetical protein
MGRHKKYSGYRSFAYLDEGLDFKGYKLVKERMEKEELL